MTGDPDPQILTATAEGSFTQPVLVANYSIILYNLSKLNATVLFTKVTCCSDVYASNSPVLEPFIE